MTQGMDRIYLFIVKKQAETYIFTPLTLENPLIS